MAAASVLVLLLGLPSRVHAQTDSVIYIGVSGTVGFGSPTAMNRALGSVNTFGSSGTGVSWNTELGGDASLTLALLFGNNIGLRVQAGVRSSTGQFKSDYFSTSANTQTGNTIQSVQEYRIYANTRAVDLEAAGLYRLSPHWSIGSGVWMNYRTKTEVYQERSIITPDNAVFNSSSRVQRVATNGALLTSPFHYGLPLTLCSRIDLYGRFALEASVGGRVDLEEIFRGFVGPAFSANARLGVSFDLTPRTDPPPPPGEREEPKLQRSDIVAAVYFSSRGVTLDSIRLQQIDTVQTMYETLPRAAAVGSRLARTLLDTSVARASRYGASVIIEGDAASIDAVRATYGVNAIQKGRTRSDSIVITTSDPRILAPIVTEQTTSSLELPELSVARYITSRAGVKEWTIAVYDGSERIALFQSSGSDQSTSLDRLAISRAGDHILRVSLRVRDTLGHVAEAFDTAHINGAIQQRQRVDVREFVFHPSTDSIWMKAVYDKLLGYAVQNSSISISASVTQASLIDHLSRDLIARSRSYLVGPPSHENDDRDAVVVRILTRE